MPGQYYDSQSGLFYNWNRYYNPAIGRYISSDPIGLEGGLNTFNYVEASPVMYSDPEGKLKSCPPYDLECLAEENNPNIEPNTPEHRARNVKNRCPWIKPKTPICTSDGEQLTDKEGNIWENDSIFQIYYHCGWAGDSTYRNAQYGWQCTYMPDGMIDDWSECMGTYDYVPPSKSISGHREKDVIPHDKDPNYEEGLTVKY